MRKPDKPNFLYNLAMQLPRRIRFVISSMILTVLILVTTFFEFEQIWFFLPLIILSVFVCTWFAVLEGISKVELFVLFIMPLFFTIFMYFFYFLFPVRWLTRVPLLIIYGFSIYAILLTSNIFNVGVEKNIQLYRAGFTVNYLYQTMIIFLITEVLMSFRLPFFLNSLAIFLAALPLAVQLLWTVHPQSNIEKRTWFYGVILALLILQVALTFSFLPLRSTIYSLLVTASYYSLGGLMYHYIDNKLFKQTIREYVFVLLFVIGIVLLTIPW